MKGISKGFDPDLGRKFSESLGGSVIARAKPLPKESAKPKSEMPLGLDAQQQHEWEMGWMEEQQPKAPSQSEAEAMEGDLRISRYLRNNPEKRDEVLAKVRASREG